MALGKKRDLDLEALIEQGIAEQQALNPDIFKNPKLYTDEEYAQLLADAAEIERIWDEVDRLCPNRPHVSAADLVNEDRGE